MSASDATRVADWYARYSGDKGAIGDLAAFLAVSHGTDGTLSATATQTALGGASASLTGATAATRYAGGTTSGSPVTGTFRVGDFVIAEDGYIWICTVAGTPGTWKQQARADTVPTLAELVSGTYAAGTFSTNQAIPVFIAPFACTIAAANIFCNGGSNVTTSDTTYWTFALRVWRAGVNLGTIASKTTKVTGGEQITVRQDWNFDTSTFDPTLKVLQKGDCLDFGCTQTSTPGSFAAPFFQVRYEPS